MASVSFAASLRRHIDVESCEVRASTVRGAMEEVFADHARLRSYVLDDQGMVRKHVAVFVNGESVLDRETLSDPLPPEAEVFVLQALSGG